MISLFLIALATSNAHGSKQNYLITINTVIEGFQFWAGKQIAQHFNDVHIS
jgi:hypothetical protein